MEHLATSEMILYQAALKNKDYEETLKIANYVPCFCLNKKEEIGESEASTNIYSDFDGN